jgi:hypothetical protein
MTYKREPDHFTRKAKKAGFAARSVYKLEEIDRRLRLLRPGLRVLDLGAADVGMRTFYIGNESAPSADMQGRLAELPELLRRLA